MVELAFPMEEWLTKRSGDSPILRVHRRSPIKAWQVFRFGESLL